MYNSNNPICQNVGQGFLPKTWESLKKDSKIELKAAS